MLKHPASQLLSCGFALQLDFQAAADAEGQLAPELTDKGGNSEEMLLVQLLEGLAEHAVTELTWQQIQEASICFHSACRSEIAHLTNSNIHIEPQVQGRRYAGELDQSIQCMDR